MTADLAVAMQTISNSLQANKAKSQNNDELLALQQELAAASEALDKARRDEAMMLENYQQQTAQIEMLMESLSQSQQASQKHMVAELSAQVQSLEKVIDELSVERKAFDDLSADFVALQANMKEKEASVAELEIINNDLRASLQDLQARQLQHEESAARESPEVSKIVELEATIQQLQSSLEKEVIRADSLVAENFSLQQSSTIALASVADLEAIKNDLRVSLQESQAKNLLLEESASKQSLEEVKIQDSSSKIQELEAMIDQLQSSLEKEVIRAESLVAENTSLRQTSATADHGMIGKDVLHTSHVRIDNLLRPLLKKNLKEWLESLCGHPINASSIWLNDIKTHCYIDFDSVEAAQHCLTMVHGQTFPPHNSQTLSADFTGVSAAEAPNSEEAALPPIEWKAKKSQVASQELLSQIDTTILQSKLDVAHSEIKSLQEAIEEANKAHDVELRRLQAELQDNARQLEDLSRLHEEAMASKAHVEELQVALEDKAKQLEELSRSYEEATTSKANTEELHRLNADLEDKTRKLKELSQLYDEAIAGKADTEELHRLQADLEDKARQLEELSRSYEEANASKESLVHLEEQLEDERRRAEDLAARYDDLLVKLSDVTMEKESSELELEQVRSDLASLAQQSPEHEIQLHEKNKFIDELQILVAKIEVNLADKTSQLESASTTRQELESRLCELEKSNSVAAAEKAKLLSELADFQASVTKLSNENDVLQSEMASVKGTKDKLVSDLETTKAGLQAYKKMMDETGKKVLQLEKSWTSQSNQFQAYEQQIQDKTIENASLRDELRIAKESLHNSQQEVINLTAKIDSMSSSISSTASQHQSEIMQLKSQIKTFTEEVTYNSSIISQQEISIEEAKREVHALTFKLCALSSSESSLKQQVQELLPYRKRAEEAEESLSKQDDKKKRDLEFLRKQNEQIASLQRSHAEAQEKQAAIVSELQDQIHQQSAELAKALDEVQALQMRLGSLSEEYEKLKLSSTSHSSKHEVLSSDGENSYELVGRHTTASSSPDGSDIISPVLSEDESTASRRLKERITMLEGEKLAIGEEVTAYFQLISLIICLTHALIQVKQLKLDIEEMKQELEKAKAKDQLKDVELKNIQAKYSQLESKCNRLEEERSRLERDIHYYEAAVSQPASNEIATATGIQRQRIERQLSIETSNLDIEGGGGGGMSGDLTGYSDDEIEIEKKGEVGVHPLLVKLWDWLRRYAPILLAYIGDKPPRLTTFGQIAVLYVIGLQLYALYNWSFPCQLA
jgi:chromosome segregation ATPase